MMDAYVRTAKLIRAVDGDTVEVSIDLGFGIWSTQTVRLAHVDAPERGRPGGTEATLYVQSTLARVTFTIQTYKSGAEKYGRYLAEITLPDGDLLHERMIAAGHAAPYEGGKRA